MTLVGSEFVFDAAGMELRKLQNPLTGGPQLEAQVGVLGSLLQDLVVLDDTLHCGLLPLEHRRVDLERQTLLAPLVET